MCPCFLSQSEGSFVTLSFCRPISVPDIFPTVLAGRLKAYRYDVDGLESGYFIFSSVL